MVGDGKRRTLVVSREETIADTGGQPRAAVPGDDEEPGRGAAALVPLHCDPVRGVLDGESGRCRKPPRAKAGHPVERDASHCEPVHEQQ